MTVTSIICSRCGKSKRATNYYSSDSPIHKHYGKIPVCKQCILDMVDPDNMRSVMNMLRMCDKPFIASLYESSMEEAEKRGGNPFQMYMKNVVMHQYRNMTWDDSDLDEKHVENIAINTIDLDREAVNRWRGWDKDDALKLEEYYQDLIGTYEHDTPIQKSIYRNISVAQMQADEAIAQGKSNDYKKYMDVISGLMNDAKIKPLQHTGVDDKGLNTWGEWVKKIEETEPIPEPTEEFKDVDGIRKYIDKWFVKHMKKVFGLEDTTSAESDVLEDGGK